MHGQQNIYIKKNIHITVQCTEHAP